MSQGTIFDFMQLATENEQLRSELVDLAANHGFTFTSAELTDEDLDGVAGGVVADNGAANIAGVVPDNGAANIAGIVLDDGGGARLGTIRNLSRLLGARRTLR